MARPSSVPTEADSLMTKTGVVRPKGLLVPGRKPCATSSAALLRRV
eukprot:CAMPEP_0184366244 /NCGR_PEP_ID=MMETSP1089-20130417/152835_1 /TAXON_ID=38269 ORGANISM="Gloeochaete wittrockiana, Strain SAG46.84" /NCGR_SAMPLE_ID=MMETSP1089 /ASSEMBLY_ACC=CAM_ASM_000445 /LENGTH=45 /DNA_ID= /DNA_START= /DNA_END= /DNA_ORIENTATION=